MFAKTIRLDARIPRTASLGGNSPAFLVFTDMADEPRTEEEVAAIRELIAALKSHEKMLRDTVAFETSWQFRLRMGIVQGLGTVVGATLVVSLVVWLLGYATQWDPVAPVAERIIHDLKREEASGPPR
jgi:hypothetical protein